MKYIIYVGGFRFPNGDAAAARVLNNGKIFRELGYNVIFVSWGGKPQDNDKKKDGNYYYEDFRYINTNELDGKVNFFQRFKNFLFRGKESFQFISNSLNIKDIYAVVVYNPTIYFSRKMKRFCKENKIYLISDITEWYAPNELPGKWAAPPFWLNEINMRITQKSIKNKILISSFLNYYYKSSHNIILPPLVDSNEKKWNEKEQVLPPFDGVRLIYAGNPAKKDLLEIMFQTILNCINDGLKIQFVIVGISKDYISHYSNYQEIISLPNNFIICGKIPQEKVPSYYHSADYSIIIRKPNRKNSAGFPTKLVESMMAGCPVISNNTSDICDYVIDGANGILLDDWSMEELQNTLYRITRLSTLEINKMKENAIRFALENFDYLSHKNTMNEFIKYLD